MTTSVNTTTDTTTEVEDLSFLRRLYTGAGGIDIVGKRKRWYQIVIATLVIALAAMLIRGFDLGLEFQGGTKMTMPPASVSVEAAEEVFSEATGVEPALVQIVGSGDGQILEITSERLTQEQINAARVGLYDAFSPVTSTGEVSPDAIGDSTVSESWGESITNRMLLAAVVFLALVFAYIAIRFERDMAIAAIAALAIDGIVIMGVYALTGLDVTPATVIGLLTVLSFSLYDTVVVFDKVDENTTGYRQSTRRTYAELANLAVNQTIMRSINTTVSTLLPIAALLIIAVWLLGVGTLQDLAIVQLIGIIQGTFSSIFIATPLVVSMKRRQRDYRAHDELVARARGEQTSDADSAAASEDDSSRADSGDNQARLAEGVDKLRVQTPTVTFPEATEGRESGTKTWRPGGRP